MLSGTAGYIGCSRVACSLHSQAQATAWVRAGTTALAGRAPLSWWLENERLDLRYDRCSFIIQSLLQTGWHILGCNQARSKILKTASLEDLLACPVSGQLLPEYMDLLQRKGCIVTAMKEEEAAHNVRCNDNSLYPVDLEHWKPKPRPPRTFLARANEGSYIASESSFDASCTIQI
jgi:hypothetical protein